MYDLYFAKSMYNHPYSSNDEYIKDVSALMDMYVEIALDLRKQNQLTIKNKSALHSFSFKGIVITDEEIDNIIESSHINHQNEIVDSNIAKNFEQAWAHINSRAAASQDVYLPMHAFFNKFNLSIFEKLCVISALSVEINRKYERLFSYIQDDTNVKLPTYGLVLALTLLSGPISNPDVYSILNHTLLSSMFINVIGDFNRSALTIELSLRRCVVCSFLGVRGEELYMKKLGYSYYPNSSSSEELEELVVARKFNQELTFTIKKLLSNQVKNRFIHIYGEEGAGKRLHVKHLAYNLGLPVIFANFAHLLSVDIERAIYFAETLALEGILNNKIICLYNVDLAESDMGNFSLIMDELLTHNNLVLVLNKTPKFPISKLARHKPFLDIEVKPLNMADTLKIWQTLALKYKIQSNLDFQNVANKFNYTPGQIKNILLKSSIISKAENTQITQEALTDTCKTFSIHNLERKATLINCKYTFDDLVIDDSQKKILISACNYIKYKDVVYEKWNFSSKVAYGRGLSIIFYGPPGTGKTMGAQVMANELGLQLYKVDVSQIMNKYVGETEKNLNDIFGEAKTSNAILLFDEADSLFGKRTDVKNSNDKFSNSEISFLLQKMEEYNGVSILTTNKFNHFDDAFRRRIKFMVNFPAPTVAMRKLLWQKIFPKNSPLGSDFDPVALADRFDLTGSSIKSIAVQAAYSAAAEAGEITMNHILDAVKYEYQKLGKVSSDQDFNLF